jgi:hypothetical protein
MMCWFRVLTVAALLLVATSAVAGRATPLVPLVVDGERYFKLQWQASEHGPRPEVHGLILNEFGFPARKVRLLVNSLDAAGAITDQTLVYVPGDLLPGSRYYFETRVPARATSYRVVVFQWEWIQAGGGDTRR